MANTRVLSEEEVQQVNQKFLEDIEFSYEEALQRHVSHFPETNYFLAQHRNDLYPCLDVHFAGLVRIRQRHGMALEPNSLLPAGSDRKRTDSRLVVGPHACDPWRCSPRSQATSQWHPVEYANSIQDLK